MLTRYLSGSSSTNFNKLQPVQNTLIRVATLTGRSDRISPTLDHLHWLPVHHHLHCKPALLMFKSYHFGEPIHLHFQLIDYTMQDHKDLTCYAKDKVCVCVVCIQHCRTSVVKYSLPLKVTQNAKTITTFRMRIKCQLYRLAYS